MTVKEFFSTVYHAPATVWNFFLRITIGDYNKAQGDEKERTEYPGLLGLILDGVKFLGRSITSFMRTHRTAIATSVWAALIVGGALALTVGLWPAALTFLANLSVLGVSIASVVGTGFAAQVAAIGAVGAVAAGAVSNVTAGMVNFISFIVSCFKKKGPSPESSPSNAFDGTPSRGPEEPSLAGSTGRAMELMGQDVDHEHKPAANVEEPAQNGPLFNEAEQPVVSQQASEEPAAASHPH